jgi:hypothetical protein
MDGFNALKKQILRVFSSYMQIFILQLCAKQTGVKHFHRIKTTPQ